jgi:hypothetical protein
MAPSHALVAREGDGEALTGSILFFALLSKGPGGCWAGKTETMLVLRDNTTVVRGQPTREIRIFCRCVL